MIWHLQHYTAFYFMPHSKRNLLTLQPFPHSLTYVPPRWRWWRPRPGSRARRRCTGASGTQAPRRVRPARVRWRWRWWRVGRGPSHWPSPAHSPPGCSRSRAAGSFAAHRPSQRCWSNWKRGRNEEMNAMNELRCNEWNCCWDSEVTVNGGR